MFRCLSLLGLLGLTTLTSPTAAQQLPAFPQPVLLTDLVHGPTGSFPRWYRAVSGRVVFFTGPTEPSSSSLGELWRTDGTPSGTFSIQPAGVEFWTFLDTPGPFLWLLGRDPGGQDSLWRTDGTAAGTVELVEGEVFRDSFSYQAATGKLFFRMLPDPLLNLWVSNGTPAGTRQIVSLSGPLGAGAPTGNRAYAELGGLLFFIQPDGPRGELWRSDGTLSGTFVVASPPPGFQFRAVWRSGSSLYLSAAGQEGDPTRLWKSDGTAAGTVEIDAFGSGTGSDRATSLDFFAELGSGRGIWMVRKAFGPPALWVTDGTPGGAVLLKTFTSEPYPPLLFNGILYFVAHDPALGMELWRTDGTPAGTRLAFDRCPGECWGLATVTLYHLGNHMLASAGPQGPEPLLTDGTPAGTYLLADICPGPCGTGWDPLVDFGGVFLLIANPATQPLRQIWATDLTPAGTRRLTDFPGGVQQSIRLGNRLLFTADDGVTGPELWSLTVPEPIPVPPAGPWLSASTLPGFEVKVRIANSGATIPGALETDCVPETLCLSGAVRGRSEVFVRIIGPRPNGRLWPHLVKFTTSAVEIWIRQTSTGNLRYYPLEGARPGFDELPGLFDREGFVP